MTIGDLRNSKAIRLWPIAMLRVYTGIFFLEHGFGKLRTDNYADRVASFLTSRLESCFDFYRPFIEAVALPNNTLFAFLVSWGEFTMGIALILGLATRYAAIAGAFMVAHFWFAKGQGVLEGQNHDVIWLVILIVLAAVHAGRIAGLDERLATRFRFLA